MARGAPGARPKWSNSLLDETLPLVCPACKTTLVHTAGWLVCSSCADRFPLREGIPSFTGRDFYWSEIPRPDMQKVIEAAKTQGWQTAVYDVLNPVGSEVHATVGDERRADWKYLLPLSRESRALDLGCGWGAAALALAETCGQVVAMDATWERVHFLDIRRRQQGVDNLYPIHGGDTLAFPFPDGYFDLVVLVGVLEWFGESYPDLPPRAAQLKALRNLQVLLRPGGHLYVGIENRLGYDYLMGRPDHNGLPFVGLLPRRLADWISKRRAGCPFRTYQYSMWGYRKLLREAGFGHIQFHGDLPQYRHPHFYIPLEGSRAFEYFLGHLWESFKKGTPERAREYRRAYRLANAGLHVARHLCVAGMTRYVVPGFSIIAQRI
jgi:SAM-dependent methyltransferase